MSIMNPTPTYAQLLDWWYQSQMKQMQPQQQQPQQIQNGGFISVRNIDVAKNYPVAPGNSVTFKDETAPYVYTKTMGFSQLESPIFEKYRLVKEDDAPLAEPNQGTNVEYVSKQDLDTVISSLSDVKKEVADVEKQLSELINKEDDGV